MGCNRKPLLVLFFVFVSVIVAEKKIHTGVFRVADFHSQDAKNSNYENSVTKTWNFKNNDLKYVCLHFTKFNTEFNRDVVTVSFTAAQTSPSRKLSYSGNRGSFSSCFQTSDLTMTFTSDDKNTASGFQGFVTYSKDEYKPVMKPIVVSKVGTRKLAVKGQGIKALQKRSDQSYEPLTIPTGLKNYYSYKLVYYMQYYTYYYYTYQYSNSYYDSSYSYKYYDSTDYSYSNYSYYSGYSSTSRTGTIAGICGGIGGLILTCCLICVRMKLRRSSRNHQTQLAQYHQARTQEQYNRNLHNSTAAGNLSRYASVPIVAIPMPAPSHHGSTVDPPPYKATEGPNLIPDVAPPGYEDAVRDQSSSSDTQESVDTGSTSCSSEPSHNEFGMTEIRPNKTTE